MRSHTSPPDGVYCAAWRTSRTKFSVDHRATPSTRRSSWTVFSSQCKLPFLPTNNSTPRHGGISTNVCSFHVGPSYSGGSSSQRSLHNPGADLMDTSYLHKFSKSPECIQNRGLFLRGYRWVEHLTHVEIIRTAYPVGFRACRHSVANYSRLPASQTMPPG